MKLTLRYPLDRVYISQGFGKENTIASMLPIYQKMGLPGHNGIDFVAADGTPVRASHDGRVTFAGYDGSGGLGVVIRTNEEVEVGSVTSYAKTIYWHLKKDSLLVTGSQQVLAGDIIGLADNTGLSTGSHLHFGLKAIGKNEADWAWFNLSQDNGYLGAIDPAPYFITPVEIPKHFYTEMKYGQRSDDILKLQGFLKRLGYFTVAPTGYYGEITAKAVLAFQRANLSLSLYEQVILRGQVVGPRTLAKLNELF